MVTEMHANVNRLVETSCARSPRATHKASTRVQQQRDQRRNKFGQPCCWYLKAQYRGDSIATPGMVVKDQWTVAQLIPPQKDLTMAPPEKSQASLTP